MTYDPTIPIGTNNISVDRAAIQVNFDQANSLFDNDHYAFNDATSANRGYHKQIYFPVASASAPSLGGFDGVFFSQNDPNDTSAKPQLYWKNSSNTYQVTNRFRDSSASGYWMLNDNSGASQKPLIFMWGTVSIPASPTSDQIPVTFPTMTNHIVGAAGFPTAVFSITTGVQCSSSTNQPSICIGTSGFSTTGFQLRYSNGGTAATVYWTAIGN